ncbi:MAG: WYL domain-containing protein [Novosphingobium sp.]
MKLRESMLLAVRPKIHERFGEVLCEIPDLEDETDFVEPDEVGGIIESLSGLALLLEYENSKGVRTQRVVTCKQFSVQAEKSYLKAYCHHRRAVRSFRLDRILDIFDPSTGESLSPVQAFFSQYSPDKITQSGLTWGLSVKKRADLIALLNALVFIARCDREFHPAEIASLESALTSFWLRMEVLGNPDFDDILEYANRLSPDGETFWIAMGRFREEKALASIFKQQVSKLIEADGVVRDVEAFWALEIDEFLSFA